MVRDTPSFLPGQACTYPDPFSIQVHLAEDTRVFTLDRLQVNTPAGITHGLLLVGQRFVVAAWRAWATTNQLPGLGDEIYLPDAFGEEQGLRARIAYRAWVPMGVNVMKLILTLELAGKQ